MEKELIDVYELTINPPPADFISNVDYVNWDPLTPCYKDYPYLGPTTVNKHFYSSMESLALNTFFYCGDTAESMLNLHNFLCGFRIRGVVLYCKNAENHSVNIKRCHGGYKIVVLSLADALDNSAINKGLIDLELITNGTGTRPLGIIFYFPITNTIYEIDSDAISPISIYGIMHETFKNKHYSLIKNYPIGDELKLIDFKDTRRTRNVNVIANENGNVIRCKKILTGVDHKSIGYCTLPGIWLYENEVWLENTLFDEWMTGKIEADQIKLYQETLEWLERKHHPTFLFKK